jgi:hypothetical protein
MRILYNTSFPTESYAFLISMNSWHIVSLHTSFLSRIRRVQKYDQQLIYYINTSMIPHNLIYVWT